MVYGPRTCIHQVRGREQELMGLRRCGLRGDLEMRIRNSEIFSVGETWSHDISSRIGGDLVSILHMCKQRFAFVKAPWLEYREE